MHTALSPYPQLFPDYIHPNEQGAVKIASEIFQTLTGKQSPGYEPNQAFPGEKSILRGYNKYDFICNGRDAIVVVPKKVAPGCPWIWRPAFLGAYAEVDEALLKKGFHVAYKGLTGKAEIWLNGELLGKKENSRASDLIVKFTKPESVCQLNILIEGEPNDKVGIKGIVSVLD